MIEVTWTTSSFARPRMRRRSGSPRGKDYKLGFLRVILLNERSGESGPAHLGRSGLRATSLPCCSPTSPLVRPTTFDFEPRVWLEVGEIKIQKKVAVTGLRGITFNRNDLDRCQRQRSPKLTRGQRRHFAGVARLCSDLVTPETFEQAALECPNSLEEEMVGLEAN